VFSISDFLTLEAGIDRLSQNVGTELPPFAALYLRRGQITHDLAMLAMVWLHMLRFSSALHTRIKGDLIYLSAKFKEKTLSYINKYDIF
jgi:hypothetical protein